MSKPYVFYIGDAFKATLVYKADGINPTDLTDITIASSIKDNYGNRVDLTITKDPNQVDNIGVFTGVGVATEDLKPGKGMMDIKYTTLGLSTHTSKLYFEIEGVVTP